MRKSIHIFSIILLFLFGVNFNAQAGSISPDLQLVLDGASPDQEIDVIVILTDQVDTKALVDTKTLKDKSLLRSEIIKELKDKADKTQKELLKFLDDKKAKKSLSFWIFNGLAVTARADLIPELAGRVEVAEVRLDFAIPLAEPIPATTGTPEWNIDAIRAPELWNLGFSGQNIVVANMDSGVDWNHNDLFGRFRGGTNSWFDPYGRWAEPHDSHPAGHGTGTMGIMVGGDATGTAIGVAPGAQWIAVKLFDDDGFADLSAIHQSFQWLLDPDGNPNTDDAPDVVNNSWGYSSLVDICYLEFQQDIQALKSSEIAVIFSAGNEGWRGPASSISPANNPESFAVGSISDTLNIAFTSSRGPSACVLENDFFPEVVAPGVSVKTADRTSGSDFDTAAFRSGTSFAGPHVAGAMALLLNAFPGLTVADVEAALMETAVDLGDIGPDNEYGYGLIDVMAAYRSLVPCTDADSDGYYAEAVCGTALDCNDNDDTIHPGVLEEKHDGIDQDCNGYDLTIEILSAVYYPTTTELEVIATSTLGDGAALVLLGYGSMIWNSVQGTWEITVAGVGGDPGTISVSGIEGAEIAATQQCTDTDGDGYFIEALCGGAPDCDDGDDTIHPGASEIKADGIDQDCNGHDLTIVILSAVYNATTMALEVLAKSGQDDTADLQLVGFGPMSWNPGQLRWEITVIDVLADPGSITVSGVEGSETLSTAPCTDADIDGYYTAAVCATLPDCNDNDDTVHPGALEEKHDGIDQDCNGHDLTIDILSAVYYATTNELEVRATSTLADTAALVLLGHGSMIWNSAQGSWEITAPGVGGDPGTISVSGIEGTEIAATQQCTNTDGDGFFAEAVCGTLPDCIDTDNTIYPGASEVKHDGIDQDCNDYDLTIEILSAVYYATTDELEVIATSTLMDTAALELVGFGSMIWNSAQGSWEITVAAVGGDPGTVSVSGIEGSEVATTQQCTNTDGDGFFAEAVCGTLPDCNDDDNTVYPGAPEIKGDEIDQDCNGHDLTIVILSAVYNATTDELEVLATSGQEDAADLQLVGFGPMIWNPSQLRWEITVVGAGGETGEITISGIEGAETGSSVPCTDADVDGYYPAAVCGTALDCDDDDPASYPGAVEIKHDGIDQDCNEYDLTIDIPSAAYLNGDDVLCVTAASILGENANLVLVSSGPMTWSFERQQWEIAVTGVGGDPGQISVQGTEGTETAGTTATVLCKGDLDGDGDVDVDDLAMFAPAFGSVNPMPNYDPAADLDGGGDVDANDLEILIANFGSTECPSCP